MALLINCECGYVARAETEEEVISLIREHMRTDHPDLFASVTATDLLGWIERE